MILVVTKSNLYVSWIILLNQLMNLKSLQMLKIYLCVNYLHVLIYPVSTRKCMNSTSFSNSDFVSVIDTVPPERRLFSKDGIHLSDFGLVKVCGILLSNLYDRIAHNLTLSGLGFEKLAQTGETDSAPLLTPLPCIPTKPNLVWANTII